MSVAEDYYSTLRGAKCMKKKILAYILIAAFLLSGAIISVSDSADAASGKWKQNGKKWWYSYSDGTYPKSKWEKIGGKWYHFDKWGYMQTGWQKISGKWYYFGTNGIMKTGWQKISKKWYYFSGTGVMQTGTKTIGGKKYTFDKNGVLQDQSADELFKKETVYFAPLDEQFYALFLHIKKGGSFRVGTEDDMIGGEELKGKIVNIVKKSATAYDMEMSSITNANWIKNGTKVHLYKKGTKISSILTKYFTNGENTDLTFGGNYYAFGKSWREMTTLPKDAIYLELEGGGYWFIIKE